MDSELLPKKLTSHRCTERGPAVDRVASSAESQESRLMNGVDERTKGTKRNIMPREGFEPTSTSFHVLRC